jgi:hypothetical protein
VVAPLARADGAAPPTCAGARPHMVPKTGTVRQDLEGLQSRIVGPAQICAWARVETSPGPTFEKGESNTCEPYRSQQLVQMIVGSCVARAIYVAAKLRVADRLADGPRAAEELAAMAGVAPRPLYRLLRALAGVGVFAQEADGRFRLYPWPSPSARSTPGAPVRPWSGPGRDTGGLGAGGPPSHGPWRTQVAGHVTGDGATMVADRH